MLRTAVIVLMMSAGVLSHLYTTPKPTTTTVKPPPKEITETKQAQAQSPTLLVYGSDNSVSYKADYDITIRTDTVALEKAFEKDASAPAQKQQPIKEFFVSTRIRDTWYKANAHCKENGMRLATFDSMSEFQKVTDSLKTLRSKEGNPEFWVSAAKFAEGSNNRANSAYFIPTLEPVATYNNLQPLYGIGACVFLKVGGTSLGSSPYGYDRHQYDKSSVWGLGDCDNTHPHHKKYFICEKEVRSPRFFQRV